MRDAYFFCSLQVMVDGEADTGKHFTNPKTKSFGCCDREYATILYLGIIVTSTIVKNVNQNVFRRNIEKKN